ncbi:Acyl-CoA synthetase (AMP-forming)/AMP-acid ligase II [Micromonospora echinaurantiaca]|uniref:Acyl-CoA synthetase (AMP-forming)/AMP-acid ligase II n=1 Tax=Micromonospora echinaurantiaca TaxID=47857 RepID=A0A1C5I3E7_9ACTN|nr:AMP-binding protein [Micromonospora echinaurantiaca]SCG52830.1 Acyl-CoA synthetase (AMP-forming)/AMP-acid ligase II [Micromonospora echinaurantiaca]
MRDIGQLVARSAQRYGTRVAVDGPGGSLTFAELGDRVVRLANALRAMGLRPGDRVLDLQSNQNRYVETDLAIRSAGLVRVALNYRLHPDDWARIADDCGAAALIYEARFAEQAESLCSAFAGRLVVVGDGPGTAYERLLADASTAALAPLDVDTLCGLHYSSGTTGHPKGALRTHRNWFASLVNMSYDVLAGRPGPDDVYVHAGPITHTSGLFVLPFLVAGATQLILPSWDPDEFVAAVEQRGATHTALVPTMVARLLARPDLDRQRLAGLKMLSYAGAPMPPEQMRQAYERLTPHLVQYYGLVEAIPPVTLLDAADHARGLADDPQLLTSAGRPALGVELAVVDGSGRRLPAGEIGEVITRGDHVMRGYWNAEGRDDLSKAVHDGWLHTGDLGWLDAESRLYLVDRKGDMIISGGYNIYPREVEDVIAEVPGVAEVAVLGVDDPDWGQRVTALYTVHDAATVTDEQVLEHCRRRLSSYKKPKELRRVDSLPLSSTGKIAKKFLRERLATEAAGQ